MTKLKEFNEDSISEKNEKERLEKRINELEAEVQKLSGINEKKNTLIAQISHEMRTPLNVVMGLSGVAMDDLDNRKKVRDNLAEIQNSSRILLGIVDNILDISSLAGGTLKVNSHKFDLKEQITGIGVFFYEHAKHKDVHFGVHIKGVSEEYLIGDEKRLQQILTNLFENSLRFTPAEGKIELTVIQGSSSRNRVHMRFVIKDTGRTIPDNVLEDLFAPSDSKEDKAYSDTGINLYVTRQLVTALGGTLEVEAHTGEGNTMTVDIPFERTRQQEMDFGAIKHHKILLVADEETCMYRGEMLADMGIAYGMTDSEYDALEILGEAEADNEPYDVCMVDTNMKNGIPKILIQEIREVFGDRPLIIATTPDKEEARTENVDADYFIDNTVFRSTIFDALMILEKGKLYHENQTTDISKKYDFSGKRILVVEDVTLNMEVVVKMLSRVNASVVCAGDGEEAVKTFMRQPAGYFDCILMDINMPVMDGYEATRQIRHSAKEDAVVVPICAMTANAFSEDVAEALSAGMDGHIAKPIDLNILYETLNRIFNGHEDLDMSERLLARARHIEEQHRQIKNEDEHDQLTGLYNLYAYEKKTYELLQKKEPVGLIRIDIDRYYQINSLYGYETGDMILKRVAAMIEAAVRTTDFVAYTGEDGFAVVVTNYGKEADVLHNKVAAVNDILSQESQDVPAVTVSAGAVFSEMGYSTEMSGKAEKALIEAKSAGPGGCVIYDENSAE